MRIIPAYAGSTRPSSPASAARPDHPRIRGEHVDQMVVAELEPGSSPHTRGALFHRSCGSGRTRIIPAYAGSTKFVGPKQYYLEDHPRIRGEHVAAHLLHGGQTGIIPAYAGSTSAGCLPTAAPADHPRIRGEHRARRRRYFRRRGSSPHTRGAPLWRGSGPSGIRIIPAYAGSTKRSTNTWRASTDHPRIRGEHVCGLSK